MITIEQATKRLLIKSPFYGLILLSIERRFYNASIDAPCKTAYATIEGINYKIVINKDFWESLENDDCRCNLLLHEIMHICLKHLEHPERFPDSKKANIAYDLEVSNYVEYISSGGYYIWNYPDLEKRAGAKYYYDHLPDQPNKENKNSGGIGIDDHTPWPKELPDSIKQLAENQLNSIIKQAAESVEKSRGTIPQEMQELINELFKKKPAIFNWKAYLRRMLGTIIDVDIKKTRKKESHRFPDASGLKHKRKSNIFLVIDTSGSISTQELADFFSEINHIWKAGAKITICECDARIQKIYEYKGTPPEEVTGRGGTYLKDAIDYFNDHRRDYQTIIFFTDGFVESDIEKIMGQSIWVITSYGDHDRSYPGKTLFIPKNQ